MAKLISKRYAVALFELAKETDKVDLFNSEIELIYNSIKNDKEFLTVLNHPRISGGEKFNLFQNIYKNNISEEILGLISIVVKKNRETEILEILEEFLELVRDYKGITTAYVFSAIALSDEQLTKIKENLSKNLNKEIIIEASVKPELIGGLLINVDGKVIDNSIKRNLDDIKKSLINN
ncbi:F0F1 ATP synthase subunit delta [uncultured Tyzzerella sp.]|uniref:F0F1 ATP synthase subunit delta n=1 Tax=uncultured Tyzzerella sp. TaxID=2321398 RepID=UPI0029431DE4|nr:F0F1 ATP synthase subunit delta [uncultured Tyzzerella sp.]